jgi:hypothetical protein
MKENSLFLPDIFFIHVQLYYNFNLSINLIIYFFNQNLGQYDCLSLDYL